MFSLNKKDEEGGFERKCEVQNEGMVEQVVEGRVYESCEGG